MKIEASVIIITKNQKHLLQKSLPVLLSQDFEGKYEIIVVDSGSTDGARNYVESLPVKLIKISPKSFNFAKAFNGGAKKAKGQYLVRLSGDAIPIEKNFLTEILKPFTNAKVGATYGRYIITGREGYGYPKYWPAERFPKKLIRHHVSPNPLKMIVSNKFWERVTSLAGACCALRGEISMERPFNERLIEAEDAEYAWFLHLVGYDIVYNPEAKVLHEHRVGQLKNTPFYSEWCPKWFWQLSWEIAKCYLERLFVGDKYKKLRPS